MAKLKIIFIFLVTYFSYVLSVSEEAIDNAKMLLIEKEAVQTATEIRKISIKTPQARIQLASMANDFIMSLNYAAYSINNAVPNVVDEEGYKALAAVPEIIGGYAYEIQKSVNGDSELLKEKLATTLENLNEAASNFTKAYNASNQFVYNQLKRKHDMFIFAIYRLKCQALLFNATNQELGIILGASLQAFVEKLSLLSNTDKTTEIELRHALQHLSTITERSVYKLENWIEVNSNSTNNVKRIQEVSLVLSDLYDMQNRAASLSHKTLHMKLELVIILETVIGKIQKLADIEYPEHTGGQEFIRSCLIDGIAFGNAYAANIKNILS